MLLSRKEMTFDFGGARLDPVRDRALLGWMMNQYLYGEVTGIQVGHWLYHAPSLEAARFLARQAVEEMQHVDNFVHILGLLGCRPAPAHPIVRFLATGMMGGSWPEHVALEMATGEGFVLATIYALIDTVDHADTVAILERAARQEERHVDFGEQQTLAALAERPGLRDRLLGLNLIWMWGVRALGAYMARRLPAHPVLAQLPAFVEHLLACADLRLARLGLADGSARAISPIAQGALVLRAYAEKALDPLRPRRTPRLTATYLGDPSLSSRPREE